jgi:hypothetical protein
MKALALIVGNTGYPLEKCKKPFFISGAITVKCRIAQVGPIPGVNACDITITRAYVSLENTTGHTEYNVNCPGSTANLIVSVGDVIFLTIWTPIVWGTGLPLQSYGHEITGYVELTTVGI